MAENVLARYFIAKCDTFENLSKCQETRVWAVPKHEKEEQPREALLVAFNTGPVVLLFSVNGSKGWEGYARLVTAPSDVSVTRNGMGEWYTFEVEWVVTFTDRFRNGLPFAKTESFMFRDEESLKSINLARNWEEVEHSIGNCYNPIIYFIILLHSVICIHHSMLPNLYNLIILFSIHFQGKEFAICWMQNTNSVRKTLSRLKRGKWVIKIRYSSSSPTLN